MTDDPTMLFLERLDEPGRFKVIKNVPIFIAHERTRKNKKTGKEEIINVDAPRLKRIVANGNKAVEKSGTVGKLTAGHINKDPAFPESKQPHVTGFQKNYKMGTFGPKKKTAILVDWYVYPHREEDLIEYPNRSVDFYPDNDEITGTALLKRDPELDLGHLAYSRDADEVCTEGTIVFHPERDNGTCLIYQREVQDMPDTIPMPKEEKPPMPPADMEGAPDASKSPPAPMDADPMDDEEGYARHCSHMKRYFQDGEPPTHEHMPGQDDEEHYSKFCGHMKQYMGGAGGAAGGAMNTMIPSTGSEEGKEKKEMGEPDKDEMMQMQRRLLPEQYRKVERAVEALSEVAKARREYAEDQIQYRKDNGVAVGDDEIEELAQLSIEDQKKSLVRIDRIAKFDKARKPGTQEPYQRPAQRIASMKPMNRGPARDVTQEEVAKIAKVASEKHIGYDEAKKLVLNAN